MPAALRPSRWAERLRHRLGGAARTRAIVLFGCVLALDTADLASLGAIASRLKPALHLDDTQLGVLAAAPALVAAFATLPLGVLADRVRRVPVLALTVALWAGAMVLCGACESFGQLLAVRLLLGAVAASSAPMIASLVGDLFWPEERSRVYGYILAGQLLGSAFGLLVCGNVAAVSWRLGVWVLALPSAGLAFAMWRLLPEPARGGASRIPHGAEEIASVEEVEQGGEADAAPGELPARALDVPVDADGGALDEAERDPALKEVVEEAGVKPRPRLVLEQDPEAMSLREAIRYVLSIPTNIRLIIASALGYFFQAGVNTFGVVFVIARFGTSQSQATLLLGAVALGALAGTVLGGRLADRLLCRGRANARVLVGGLAFIASALVFAPGLLSGTLVVALPLYILAAAFLGAPNGPLDAARLDIMPGRLWGRAESIRTTLRSFAVAAAPLLFGVMSDAFAHGPRSTTKEFGYQANAAGLKYAFLVMLAPMAIGGVLILRGARDYTRDVATALASDERIE